MSTVVGSQCPPAASRWSIWACEESVMEEGKIDSSEIKDKNDHVDQDSSTSNNVGFGICKLGGRNGDDGKQKYFSIGRVLVDVERGRTVPNWRLRRLGGGLGTTRTGSEEFTQKHSVRAVFHLSIIALVKYWVAQLVELLSSRLRYLSKHSRMDIRDTLGELGLTFVKIAKFETENAIDLSQRRRAAEIKQGEVEQADGVRYPERERGARVPLEKSEKRTHSRSLPGKKKRLRSKKLGLDSLFENARGENWVATEVRASLLVREREGGELSRRRS
ncbi:hypothetical protein ZIOFF_038282 [Zingiber officinale]|uniref:Uncharacterized protein n=1 Tax=Zingiber officinale TaxID=94328 RepID=A0A8J5G571_ZINOF|nr:hypothetical protein ZIOFF_038282 [Zingiber officinale]